MSSKTELFQSQYKNFKEMCEVSDACDSWDEAANGLIEDWALNDLFALALHFIAVDGQIDAGEVEAFNTCLGYDYSKDELCELYEIASDIIDYGVEERLKEDLMTLEQYDTHLSAAFEGMVLTLLEILAESDGIEGYAETQEINRLKEVL